MGIQRSPHIVCFAPYTDWSIHSARQVTILQALRLRGCTVTYVTCDGAFSDCDLLQASTGAPRQKPANACLFCQARVATRLAGWGMPFQWLSRWLTSDDRKAAASWVQSLSPDQYPSAQFKLWEIGKWMKSSVHKHLRHNVLDLGDSSTLSIYGSYLYSGVLAAIGLDRLFDEERPAVQLLFNGRMGPTRIALELAKEKGIRTICEERAYPLGRMMLFDNVNCLDFTSFANLWLQWKSLPLNAEECEETKQFFLKRWTSAAGDITVFSSGLGQGPNVLTSLGLDPGISTLALFTSSLDEATDLEPLNEPFQSQYEWIDKTIEFVAGRSNLQLVVRAHPNSGSRKSFGSNPQDVAYFESLPGRLPPNVKLIASDSKLSSYDLAKVASVGLVWRSTIGIEMAAMGRPVIRLAHGPMAYADFLDGPSTPEQYKHVLERLTATHPTPSSERAAQAWRFAYAFYYRWSKPFSLVKQPNWYTGEMGYSSPDALAPGADPGLDHICDVFLGKSLLHLPPGSETPRNAGEEAQVLKDFLSDLYRS